MVSLFFDVVNKLFLTGTSFLRRLFYLFMRLRCVIVSVIYLRRDTSRIVPPRYVAAKALARKDSSKIDHRRNIKATSPHVTSNTRHRISITIGRNARCGACSADSVSIET